MTNQTTLPTLNNETLLTTQQLAALTNISRQTYEGWRYRGDGGPSFIRLGPTLVRYRWATVRDWLAKYTTSSAA